MLCVSRRAEWGLSWPTWGWSLLSPSPGVATTPGEVACLVLGSRSPGVSWVPPTGGWLSSWPSQPLARWHPAPTGQQRLLASYVHPDLSFLSPAMPAGAQIPPLRENTCSAQLWLRPLRASAHTCLGPRHCGLGQPPAAAQRNAAPFEFQFALKTSTRGFAAAP